MATEEKEITLLNQKDIEDYATIPREEAKKQFDYVTKALNLKHNFSFDEVYDILLKQRLNKQKKEEFRKNIVKFEDHIRNLPDAMFCEDNCFPLTHTFGDGLYIRQLTVPAKILTVTKIHKQTHPFFLLKGTISILTEDGVKKITAPYSGITKAGTKRIIWHHDEVVIVTVHATEETDLIKIEDEVIAKDFGELTNEESEMIEHFIDVVSKEV